MNNKICILITLLMPCLLPSTALASDMRLTPHYESINKRERSVIARMVCEDTRYDLTEQGFNCRSCPSYTGQAGDRGGMQVENLLPGHFSSAGTSEILLDTSGCEAHHENFGGAILLRKLPGALAIATDKPNTRSNLEFIYYKPGFRLDDCLEFDNKGQRTLLVCNEYWMGQGEIIGHISSIEIFNAGITRWRLLRWYDNTSSDTSPVISIVPDHIDRVIQRGPGRESVHITLSVAQLERTDFDKRKALPVNSKTLVFIREGERFFADENTRTILGELSTLTRNLDE